MAGRTCTVVTALDLWRAESVCNTYGVESISLAALRHG
jgi:hypothetical protein